MVSVIHVNRNTYNTSVKVIAGIMFDIRTGADYVAKKLVKCRCTNTFIIHVKSSVAISNAR